MNIRMQIDSQKTESLFELAVALGQQSDFSEILRVVSTTATGVFNANLASIVMLNPGTQNTVKTIIKDGGDEKSRGYKLLQTNLIGWSLKHKQAMLSADIATDNRFAPEISQKFGAKTAMCAPLQISGNAIGCLLLIDKTDGGAFAENDIALLEKMAAIAAPFLDNVQKIQSYFDKQIPDSALVGKYEALGMLGKSKPYVELLKAIEAAARCDVRVQLQGKSGTGKEKIAKAIHQFSSRHNRPFVAIDCGAIPENLIESELFGHAKGAFTGANYDRKGLIEEANGGTFFMDEIANLPFDMQSKLLRVLQEGEIRVIGSNKPRKVDVRIISASSSDLRQMVDAGKFREDLFYRLHVYPIDVPTLNQRRDDIPLLANHFLKKFADQQKKQAESFHEWLLDYMQLRVWSGNIRELENFVERLVTLAAPEMVVLDASILPKEFRKEYKDLTFTQDAHDIRKSLQETLEETEVSLIRQALVANDWNQSKAARALQISERAIRYKMEKLGIEKPS